MHELEKFVYHCLEKFPVSFEKSRVLANDVHNITCDHSLIILSPNHFCESQQLFDEINKEAFLGLFV
jgi:hypothetical protein